MTYINNKYNGCVIEVLDKEHGQKVKEFWREQEVDVTDFYFSATKQNNDSYRYYGIIDGIFSYYRISDVKESGAIIMDKNLKSLNIPDITGKGDWLCVSNEEDFKHSSQLFVSCRLDGEYVAFLGDSKYKSFRYAKRVEKKKEITLNELIIKAGYQPDEIKIIERE